MTMGRFAALGAATAGAAAAASFAWMGITQSPRGPSGNPANPPPDGTAMVCVAADSVLRAFDIGTGCPAGQTALALTPAGNNSADGPNVLDLEDDWGRKNPAAPAKPSGETDPLADLELRMDKLERSPLFTVVDEQHNPIFAVTPNSVLLYNS